MSQVKIILQPPPNVDFVTGYPGIPPGPDRPQASVKGAVEVRLPLSGVKAKWVRIELRKVETLAGGGPSNTFYDFVGPSPVNLWSTSDEYSLLRSQDFPFSIRIPESIPPSVALDNKAGIAYELVASVCTKGKRGFLRKAKSVVASAVAPITIDKHELHATWPVYCQPEQRQIAQDGVTLIVDRSNTCYGPGDRVSVMATVKSDSLHTVILRGYEFFLRESTVYRAGVHATGRKNTAPQVKQVNIAETKVPVNATLYGGTKNATELSFMISANHTTTTLNAARHIDITYTLCIKALMGTGTHIIMDLPVIISNWQRHVSYEAISRIGPAPSLSLLPASQTLPSRVEPSRGRPSDIIAATLPINRTNAEFGGNARNNSIGAYNSLPGATSASAIKSSGDDLSYTSGYALGRGVDDFGSTKPVLSINPTVPGVTPVASSNTNASAARNASASSRLHVKNVEVPQESISRNRSAQATDSGAGSSSTSQSQWPTAEEEKRRYENARNNVAKVQGPASAPPPLSMRSASPPPATTSSPPRGATSTPTPKQWLSAEEEKRLLFQKAQEAVHAKQGQIQPEVVTIKPQIPASGSSKLTGAALYQQAVNARSGGSGYPGGSSYTNPARSSPAVSPVPQYLTAEQEKAALRRYEEAKRAVEHAQNDDTQQNTSQNASGNASQNAPQNASQNPIAYDSLFPSNNSNNSAPAAGSSSSSQPVKNDAPPSFEIAAVGSDILSQISEKERLRRKYEAEDAAALARTRTPPPAAYTTPPPAPTPTPAPVPLAPPLHSQYTNAQEEKEAARRRFEERDARAAAARAKAQNAPPSVPNNNTPAGASPPSPGRLPNATPGSRPAPQPPTAGGIGRVLTAAEEKAALQAKFEARDGGRKPAVPPVQAAPAPPPLMPRPPVEYIIETQDEDARLSRLNGEVPNLNGAGASTSGAQGPLDMKPFTPFRSAFDTPSSTPGPPPPLPRSGE